MGLELEGVGSLVQDDPEPQPVHRNPKPARRRDYVPIEEEDLTRLSRLLHRTFLAGDEGTRVVLAEDAGGEEAQEQSYLGRERRRPEDPREVVRTCRRATEDRLQDRPEALDVEVDPLGPVGDPHRAFSAGRYMYVGEVRERTERPLYRRRVIEIGGPARNVLRARRERHGDVPGDAPGDHAPTSTEGSEIGFKQGFPTRNSIYAPPLPGPSRVGASRVVRRGEPGYICGVFGIGGQELIIIGVLFLVIFWPSKPPQMARDLGKFVTEARRSMDEFKGELLSDEDDKDEDRLPKRKRGAPPYHPQIRSRLECG